MVFYLCIIFISECNSRCRMPDTHKRGRCPVVSPLSLRTGCANCKKFLSCDIDYNCPGNQKCCLSTNCGFKCMKPEKNDNDESVEESNDSSDER